MAEWKRFQGPGQQWATHGGYYLGTNWRNSSMRLSASGTARQTQVGAPQWGPHGGLAKIVTAAKTAWNKSAAENQEVLSASQQHAERFGGPPAAGPAPGNVISPSQAATAAPKAAPKVAGVGGKSNAERAQMSFDLSDIGGENQAPLDAAESPLAAGVAVPPIRSRRESFGQFGSSFLPTNEPGQLDKWSQ